MLEMMADRLMRLLPMLVVRRFDRRMGKAAPPQIVDLLAQAAYQFRWQRGALMINLQAICHRRQRHLTAGDIEKIRRDCRLIKQVISLPDRICCWFWQQCRRAAATGDKRDIRVILWARFAA